MPLHRRKMYIKKRREKPVGAANGGCINRLFGLPQLGQRHGEKRPTRTRTERKRSPDAQRCMTGVELSGKNLDRLA